MRPQEVFTALVCSLLLLLPAMAGRATVRRTSSRQSSHVRGGSFQAPSLRHRQLLHPMHHGHGGTSYLGCLNYTNAELEEEWNFQGDAPECSYTSYGNYGDDDDNADNNGDDDANGGGNGNGGGDDDQTQNRYGDDDEANGDNKDDQYAADMDDDMYGGNGGNNNGGNGNDGRNGNNGDGGYVVNNEDIAGGAYDGNENPMTSFNISQCSTYENLWVWDLAFSCDSDVALEHCEWTFTEKLMEAEMISCNDIEQCPKECPVCETCFKLVGCVPVPDLFEKNGTTASTFFAICAAIGLFLFGVGYYYCRHHGNGDENSLEANLIDKDLQDAVDKIPPADQGEDYDPEDVPDFRSDLSSLDSHTVYTVEPDQSLLPSPGVHGVPHQINLSSDRPNGEGPQDTTASPSGQSPTPAGPSEQGTATETNDIIPKSTPQLEDTASLASDTPSAYQPPHPVTQDSSQGNYIPIPEASLENAAPPVASSNGDSAPPKADATPPTPSTPPTTASPSTNGPSVPPFVPILPTRKPPTEPQKSSPDAAGNTVETPPQRVIPFVLSARKKPTEKTENENESQKEESPDLQPPSCEPARTEATNDNANKINTPVTKDASNDSPTGETTSSEESNDKDTPGAFDKPSDASDVSRSEGSETPWIGDIDLSYAEPSFEDALQNLDDDEEDAQETSKEETPKSAQKRKEDEDDTPYDETTSVWLAPIDDLEAPFDEDSNEQPPRLQTPSTPTTEQVEPGLETAESEVWLAPTTSPAELAPEDKEDDSSTSSWSPDDSGPWLAPI